MRLGDNERQLEDSLALSHVHQEYEVQGVSNHVPGSITIFSVDVAAAILIFCDTIIAVDHATTCSEHGGRRSQP